MRRQRARSVGRSSRPRNRSSDFYFPWAGVANGKGHIESHYPTQAKVRLEWGTQHLLPVRQKLLRASPVFFGPGTLVRTWGTRPVPMGSCCDLGSLKDGFTNRMGRPVCRIEAVSTANLSELLRLYIAYRVFYGEAAEEERAIAFIRERVTQSAGRYFLAWDETSRAIGFMHLMPSTSTLAM